jgi:hypothetical protein
VSTATPAVAEEPAALEFSLRLPEHWFDFSILHLGREHEIAEIVHQRCLAAGLDADLTAGLTESARRSVRLARESGVLHGGGTFEVCEDGPLTVSVVVSALVPPQNGDILAALVAVEDVLASPSSTWHRTTTVRLPGPGRAARVHGVQDVTFEGSTMRTAFMHTVVPLPGSEKVLVVTGSSPNLAEVDDVFDLLATITATLEISAA